MKVLLVSMLFVQFEQALPFFFEHLAKMQPKPVKIIFFDFLPEQKFDYKSLGLATGVEIFVEKKQFDKDFAIQLAGLRNHAIGIALKENFDAVLFLQSNIFPPSDLLLALEKTRKEIVAPSFFTLEKNTVFSNAIKISGKQIIPFLFNDLLPSGLNKADSVLLSAVFFKKSFFSKLEFVPVQDTGEELFFLAQKAKDFGKEIFIDSSIVCARLSQTQLFSHYYFTAQKNNF